MKKLFINFIDYYTDRATRKVAFSYLHADIKEADLMHPQDKEMIQKLMNQCYQFEKKYKFIFRKSNLAKSMIDSL